MARGFSHSVVACRPPRRRPRCRRRSGPSRRGRPRPSRTRSWPGRRRRCPRTRSRTWSWPGRRCPRTRSAAAAPARR
eukprot:8258541-Pyramimonas_sp.AAC.1